MSALAHTLDRYPPTTLVLFFTGCVVVCYLLDRLVTEEKER